MYQLLRSWKQLGLSMQKKAAGNDIYAIALADDDGGVWGSMIHNSQHLDKVVLTGRRGSQEGCIPRWSLGMWSNSPSASLG